MERGGPELPGTFLCPFLSKPGKKPWEAWGVLRLGRRSSELGALPRASQLGTPGGVGTWGGRRRPGLILVLPCLLGPLRKEKQSCFQFLSGNTQGPHLLILGQNVCILVTGQASCHLRFPELCLAQTSCPTRSLRGTVSGLWWTVD